MILVFKLLKKIKFKNQLKKSAEDFKAIWNCDLNTVWTITDKNQFLIAMNGWLCRKCNYGEDTEKLSDAEKVFYLNTQLESEVNNGGFSQFFYNNSGNFANETLNALNAIGASQTANIYKKALLAFGSDLPMNRELLNNLLTDAVEQKLNECDTEFYQYPDKLEELNYQFIFNNKEHFT